MRLAWRLLIGAVMATVADTITARVMEAGDAFRGTMQLAAGMSMIAAAFAVAQLLLFLEELWWTP
jgi:sulfite exporter TauE/SafE